MLENDDSKAAERLSEFAAAHPEVVAVYVFGSQASGVAGPLSDFDVALLLDTDAVAERSDQQPLGPQAHYAAELRAAMGRADVDVVLLDRATPLLAHRVIAGGRLVFCRDDRARSRFHARALMRYLDTRPLRQIEQSYLRRRLAEDRFGRAKVQPAHGTARADAGGDRG